MPKLPAKPRVPGLQGGGGRRGVAEAAGLEGWCVPQDPRAEGLSPRGWAAAMATRAELQSVRGGGHEVAHTEDTGPGRDLGGTAGRGSARLGAGTGL